MLKELKECKSNNQHIIGNLKFSFDFYSLEIGRKDGIKECGVWPLNTSDIEYELFMYLEDKEIEDQNEKQLCPFGHHDNEHQPKQIEDMAERNSDK